jgi:hypothetical protein
MTYPLPVPASRRHAVVGVVSALTTLLLAGCALSPATLPLLAPVDTPDVHAAFTLDGGPDVADQLVTIENEEDSAVAPVLAFTALDEDDQPLTEVKVFTAFGSDRGRVVVPPGTAYDVLQFLGTGVERIADVAVRVVKAPTVDVPYVAEPPTVTTTAPVGADKGTFGGVKVTNDNDVAITLRVVYIVREQETAGLQPFRTAYDVGDLLTVPARGSAVAPLDGPALVGNLQYGDSLPWNVDYFYSK